MKFILINIIYLICVLSCRPGSNQSDLKSLNTRDISSVIEGKKVFDKSTKKYMIALYSENSLSDGGASFWDGLQSLMKTNLGDGYETFIISSSPKSVYGTASKISHFQAHTRTEVIDAVRRIVNQINRDREKNQLSRVEVFFSLLAHGSTTHGGGDGFFSLVERQIPVLKIEPPLKESDNFLFTGGENAEQRITWSELWSQILEPLADVSTEMVAVLEPCFSGNIMPHIPRSANSKNILLMTGESALAPQAAIGTEAQYVTSLLTQSLTFGLRGYANDTTKANEPFHDPAPELVQYGLKNIDDVTVAELIQYTRANTELRSCERRLKESDIRLEDACEYYNNIKDEDGMQSESVLRSIFNSLGEDQASADLRVFALGGVDEIKQTITYHSDFAPSRIQIFTGGNMAQNPENLILGLSSQSVTVESANNQSGLFLNNVLNKLPTCRNDLETRFQKFVKVIKHTYALTQGRHQGLEIERSEVEKICKNFEINSDSLPPYAPFEPSEPIDNDRIPFENIP